MKKFEDLKIELACCRTYDDLLTCISKLVEEINVGNLDSLSIAELKNISRKKFREMRGCYGNPPDVNGNVGKTIATLVVKYTDFVLSNYENSDAEDKPKEKAKLGEVADSNGIIWYISENRQPENKRYSHAEAEYFLGSCWSKRVRIRPEVAKYAVVWVNNVNRCLLANFEPEDLGF